jgi:hypothetical protein
LRRDARAGLARDLKVSQEMLGHSSVVTTADTYTSVLPETAHRAAQATTDMITEAAQQHRRICGHPVRVTQHQRSQSDSIGSQWPIRSRM